MLNAYRERCIILSCKSIAELDTGHIFSPGGGLVEESSTLELSPPSTEVLAETCTIYVSPDNRSFIVVLLGTEILITCSLQEADQ